MPTFYTRSLEVSHRAPNYVNSGVLQNAIGVDEIDASILQCPRPHMYLYHKSVFTDWKQFHK